MFSRGCPVGLAAFLLCLLYQTTAKPVQSQDKVEVPDSPSSPASDISVRAEMNYLNRPQWKVICSNLQADQCCQGPNLRFNQMFNEALVTGLDMRSDRVSSYSKFSQATPGVPSGCGGQALLLDRLPNTRGTWRYYNTDTLITGVKYTISDNCSPFGSVVPSGGSSVSSEQDGNEEDGPQDDPAYRTTSRPAAWTQAEPMVRPNFVYGNGGTDKVEYNSQPQSSASQTSTSNQDLSEQPAISSPTAEKKSTGIRFPKFLCTSKPATVDKRDQIIETNVFADQIQIDGSIYTDSTGTGTEYRDQNGKLLDMNLFIDL
ncbi:MAG: hypothetical protein M1825_000377 [Sarcosagium campestre]|nr:MAG: hypothetical protein M1825_000377 [Sarcosagium campestre]